MKSVCSTAPADCARERERESEREREREREKRLTTHLNGPSRHEGECDGDRICSGKWDTWNPLVFWKEKESSTPKKKSKLSLTCQLVVIVVPTVHKLKVKVNRKKKKNLDQVRELKKIRYMKLTLIYIVVGSLRTARGAEYAVWTSPYESPRYDTKPRDGEDLVLEFGEYGTPHSLPNDPDQEK